MNIVFFCVYFPSHHHVWCSVMSHGDSGPRHAALFSPFMRAWTLLLHHSPRQCQKLRYSSTLMAHPSECSYKQIYLDALKLSKTCVFVIPSFMILVFCWNDLLHLQLNGAELLSDASNSQIMLVDPVARQGGQFIRDCGKDN